MASFIVVTTDLRRVTAKVSPGGYMIDLLEDACLKLKIPSEAHQLKHNGKSLNLTDPVRAAGLPAGAKLELVVKSKSPSAVTVAVRLPPSEARHYIPNNRLTAKVRNDTPLWKLLRHLEEEPATKQTGLSITGRGVPRLARPAASEPSSSAPSGAGQLFWESPVLKFAGRELASLDDFRKTLSQVGIDAGSQLIHLEFRITDLTMQMAVETVHRRLEQEDAEEAAEAASVTTAATATAAATAATASKAKETLVKPDPAVSAPQPPLNTETQQTQPLSPPQPAAAATVPKDAVMTDQQPSQPPEAQTDISVHHPVQVWSPPKAGAGMPAAASLRWARESATTGSGATTGGVAPTIAQMKAHQKHLEEAGRNKRLKSDTELEEEAREREARAAAVNKVDVRIRFPDGYTVLWSFPNGATGATLHAAVRTVLTEEIQQEQPAFRLVPPMSRDAILDKSGPKHDLVRGYGMRGGVAINFLRGGSSSSSSSSFGGRPSPAAAQTQYVKLEIRSLAQDIVVPRLDDGDDNQDEEEAEARRAAEAAAEAASSRKDKAGDAAKKVSKFLRLSKK